jgi:Kef-type K+ transport system membrane component KefB
MSKRVWIYPVAVTFFILVIAGVLQFGDRTLKRVETVADSAIGVAGGHAAAAGGSTGATASAAPVHAAAQGPLEVWRTNAGHPLAQLILQLVVIVIVARAFGAVARRFGQPPVIGEIAAGVALGPSLLGLAVPGFSAWLFPPASLGMLHLLSQVGVILFMFVVGLDLEWATVKSKAHAAVAVSHVSILFPFLLGVLAALPLYREHAPAGISFQAFALFMGIAMSITAFPVLARILEERGLSKTPIGSTAITCAAVDDVTAWTLLAFVVAVVTAGGALVVLGATLGIALLFTAAMVFVVRPTVRPFFTAASSGAFSAAPGRDPFSKDRIALVIGVLFGAALTTEIIGVHALFGAFLAGAIMPTDADFRRGLRERLESFSSVFLLPLFFAFTGLRTQIGLLDTPAAWLTCLGIILLATIGKFGGSALTARAMGFEWSSAVLLGALMNTRGLMELIALNVGYDLGVISPEMFTSLVLMALLTTSLTGPLVDLALSRQSSTGRLDVMPVSVPATDTRTP